MHLFSRFQNKHDEASASTSTETSAEPTTSNGPDTKSDPETAVHQENVTKQPEPSDSKPAPFAISRTGDGDTAMALFNSPSDLHTPFTPAEESRLVRKIDLMILPYLAVCYAFFYIDKTTLSYAAIFGIREDLDLTGDRYNWLSSIFYFGFLAWALPTNLALQRFPVGKYLGANIVAWGVFLMLQAAATDFASLAALRAISGAAEACSDPAFMLITSMWYTRKQQPVRIGLWYTANGFGIALGGLLGYAIGHIRGALPSWKYEFLIIGALCCIWGIVMLLFLPDSPVTARSLSPRERLIAVERLRSNQTGIENKTLKSYQIIEALRDPKTMFFFLLGAIHNTPNGGISNFGTIIIRGFGYSTLVTTLLQVPYGVLIAIFILVCVYANDFTATKRGWNTRCAFILIFTLPNIAGTFGLRYVPQDRHIARLMCYYLTGAYNASFVLVLSLAVANTAGHTKKVFTNAILFLGYCAGNIAGPFFYKSEQSPTYPLGIWSMIFCHLTEVVIVSGFWLMMSRENRKRDKKYGKERDVDRTAFGDLTDFENTNFRYVY